MVAPYIKNGIALFPRIGWEQLLGQISISEWPATTTSVMGSRGCSMVLWGRVLSCRRSTGSTLYALTDVGLLP